MDYIPSSMFQLFDQTSTDDLLQMISTFPRKLDPKHEIQLEDHDQVPPPTPSQVGHGHPPHKLNSGRRSRSSSVADHGKNQDDDDDDHDENPNDKKKKKKMIIHREIERQRRQEMSALYASLRSLIPLQYLKGKRSMSDQMHEAAKYIKDLQRKNQELSTKRDNLRRLSNSSSSASSCNTSTDIIGSDQNSKRHNKNLEPTKISMTHCKAGSVEVLVNTAFGEGLSLARVVGVLTGEGFNVVRCISAKVNGRYLHTIESEAVSGEIKSMDLPELEKKLKNLIV
ncbi:Basic helix-loop-helix transcription factor [Parasponia andersonii]|uniref:Basic helix-loop-helix transcription factor n=1 Tax=Parasponia andersonii TaxID=3476 RepID=A0A2P5C8U1_PARAD|nr:Basic helix-loop-helix transcription factor [Parasponia andersonii]